MVYCPIVKKKKCGHGGGGSITSVGTLKIYGQTHPFLIFFAPHSKNLFVRLRTYQYLHVYLCVCRDIYIHTCVLREGKN